MQKKKVTPAERTDFKWMSRVDVEVRKVELLGLMAKSKHYRKNMQIQPEQTGFRYSSIYDLDNPGFYAEWQKGFDYFCNQTTNTKGHRVNRKHLKLKFMPKILFEKK